MALACLLSMYVHFLLVFNLLDNDKPPKSVFDMLVLISWISGTNGSRFSSP